MVALAPNSSETSPWDVLDTFPKPHSRAREAKTSNCTEVPHSKSRNRIEIWLTIYESCEGLESFTRDPIGFEGSDFNLYEYVNSKPLVDIDPSGEFAVPAICATLCIGGIACTAPCLSVCGADPQCMFECYSMMSTYGQIVCGGAILGCGACLCKYAGPACGAPLALCLKNPRKCLPRWKKPPVKKPPLPGCLPCAPTIMYTNPLGPLAEQCPETCKLRRATKTPPCWCYYRCPSVTDIVKLPNLPL